MMQIKIQYTIQCKTIAAEGGRSFAPIRYHTFNKNNKIE